MKNFEYRSRGSVRWMSVGKLCRKEKKRLRENVGKNRVRERERDAEKRRVKRKMGGFCKKKRKFSTGRRFSPLLAKKKNIKIFFLFLF